jgi:threonine dehydrogenase-like Zn-dependent dehydrogenase
MQAWRIHGYGDMRLEEVPEPAPRPGWVKVRVRVVQPSVTEIALFRGEKTYGRELVERALAGGPAQLFGHEFSGEVVELGAGVTELAVGDRVAARGSHPEGIVGFHYPGAFAEYGVFPASLFCRLPPAVDDAEGAAIQALTDAVAAVHSAALTLGDTVVILGLGAMGLGCLQVARNAGAGVTIGIARRARSLAVARELGCAHVLDAERDDVRARVRELTGGALADVAFETAAGPAGRGLGGDATVRLAGELVRPGGTVVAVGFTEGPTPLPQDVYRMRGVRVAHPSPLDRRLFETTVHLVATGRVRLKPTLAEPLAGLERLPEAFERTAERARFGLINPAQVRVSGAPDEERR